MQVALVLQGGAVIAALVSAGFWFAASLLKIPSPTEERWEGGGLFSDALALQARLNACGALFVTLSALLQGASLLALPMLNGS